MGYASIPDLYIYGLPQTAVGNLSNTQLQDALDNASAQIDSYYRGRYSLPLLAWDVETTRATCVLAAYDLMNIRGYDPTGNDVNLLNRYNDTVAWLNKVQRQAVHPNVTPQPNNTPNWNQPTVNSFSVVDVWSGRRAPNRGW